jgi:hypothetical protein
VLNDSPADIGKDWDEVADAVLVLHRACLETSGATAARASGEPLTGVQINDFLR